MKLINRLLLLLVFLGSIAALPASDVSRDSAFEQSDIFLSQYFSLQPQEIKQWRDIKSHSSLQGFVNYQNMSVYEVLALYTEDRDQLRRYAELFARHNVRIIKRLNEFDLLYQQEVKKIK